MVAALANATNSEMHVVHVGQVVHMIFAFTEEEPGQVGRIEAAGGNVAQVHLRSGGATGEVVTVAEDMGVGLIVMGSRGARRDKAVAYGQRLRLRGSART
jgi:nucleotide-binding universal stress UspA family protein